MRSRRDCRQLVVAFRVRGCTKCSVCHLDFRTCDGPTISGENKPALDNARFESGSIREGRGLGASDGNKKVTEAKCEDRHEKSHECRRS